MAAVLAVSALFALSQALHPIQDMVIGAMARRMWVRTDRRVLAASLTPATVAHLESPALLDKVEAATILSPAGPGSAVRAVLHLARARIAGVAALGLVAHFRWWLAALLFATEVTFGWTWAPSTTGWSPSGCSTSGACAGPSTCGAWPMPAARAATMAR